MCWCKWLYVCVHVFVCVPACVGVFVGLLMSGSLSSVPALQSVPCVPPNAFLPFLAAFEKRYVKPFVPRVFEDGMCGTVLHMCTHAAYSRAT